MRPWALRQEIRRRDERTHLHTRRPQCGAVRRSEEGLRAGRAQSQSVTWRTALASAKAGSVPTKHTSASVTWHRGANATLVRRPGRLLPEPGGANAWLGQFVAAYAPARTRSRLSRAKANSAGRAKPAAKRWCHTPS
jgi:hypothetical protein